MKKITKPFETICNKTLNLGFSSFSNNHGETSELLINYLSQFEKQVYEKFPSPKRQLTYLMGRYCAKKALIQLNGKVMPSDITIDAGHFGQPVPVHSKISNTQVSISHTRNGAVALAFPDSLLVGIDLELISRKNENIIRKLLTKSEKSLLNNYVGSSTEKVTTLFWSCKESLAKALKIGLFPVIKLYQIKNMEMIDTENTFKITYKYFPQFETFSFISNENIFSITSPKEIFSIQDIINLKLQWQETL
jgi:4'-phosphopantetheinyl transferase